MFHRNNIFVAFLHSSRPKPVASVIIETTLRSTHAQITSDPALLAVTHRFLKTRDLEDLDMPTSTIADYQRGETHREVKIEAVETELADIIDPLHALLQYNRFISSMMFIDSVQSA